MIQIGHKRYSKAIKPVFALLLSAWLLVFTGGGDAASRKPSAAECPQPRFTGKAPEALYQRVNPLPASKANRRAGRDLYEDLSNPACALCHGKKGRGDGQLASQFDPRPRNFACAETVNGIPDGQLHWIIQNGSPGTSMPAFGYLNETEIWQLVLYLRSLAEDD